MEICAKWFAKQMVDSKDSIKVLVFNVTGDRDSELILKQLHSINFDYVCFSTNITSDDTCNDKNGNLLIYIRSHSIGVSLFNGKIVETFHRSRLATATVRIWGIYSN
jgi:hypothetical protein